jgi:hypothetical protein
MVLILGQTLVIDYVWSNHADTREFVWAQLLSGDTPLVLIIVLGVAFCALLLMLFVLLTALFIPLGQFTASKFVAFRPLPGWVVSSLSVVGHNRRAEALSGMERSEMQSKRPPRASFDSTSFRSGHSLPSPTLQRETAPGYTINIVSSLAGILLYTWVSFLMRPRPLLWFPLAGVAALCSVPRDRWWKPVVSGALAPTPVVRDLSVDRSKARFEE